MDKFRALLSAICARPAMYVGYCSLQAVANVLSGYCLGLADCGQPVPFGSDFQCWCEMKFTIRSAAWNWTRILLHVHGNDSTALAALPSLYEEFLRDREKWGMDLIEAEAIRRLNTEYGRDWGEPKETKTNPRSNNDERTCRS